MVTGFVEIVYELILVGCFVGLYKVLYSFRIISVMKI